MEYVKLNNGVEMPVLGFGVYQISDPEVCERAVGDALKIGYRSIDTAAAYDNEEAVGRAVRRSGIPREELFITTKLATGDQGFQSSQDACKASLNACLKNILPFLILGLIFCVLSFFAALPVGLGFLVLLPVLSGTAYASYQDVFIAH